MDLAIRELPAGMQKEKNLEVLKFGEVFTDRMFTMEYAPGKGWHDARIEPFHNLELSPATMSLHYAQEIFEGMKAYSRRDGSIAMFRPNENWKRMSASAEALCMPAFDEKFVMGALTELIKLERGWVPTRRGTSLYIRPTMLGVDPVIKVRASEKYLFYIILSPVGAYFSADRTMSKIMVEDRFVRAVRGGLGLAKTGANYAASIRAGMEAAKKGCDQVLWLDGVERRYVEEIGSMNIFFVIDDVITTPALNGSILPGITRKSVLELAAKLGFKTAERAIEIDEVMKGIENGSVSEMFGSGTACVINPVSTVLYKGKEYAVTKEPGKYAKVLGEYLTGIQYGEKEDMFGWMRPL
ncbi:MAG TPA: branched-chain amino acid aminotransferase [bacterium]|nr:branched-chain amino acid aminotransferase [bacterium]